MVMIQIGFAIPVMIFILYWSIVLEDGIIVRRFSRYEFLLFGSIRRVLALNVTISLFFGIIGSIIDSTQVLLFLLMNTLALPISLLVFSYFLMSLSIDEQLTLWRYDFDNDIRAAQLGADIENLITHMKNTGQLIKFFKVYIDANSEGTETIKTSIQQLQDRKMIPLELSNLILSI